MHGRVRGSIPQEVKDGLRRKAAMFADLSVVIDKGRKSGDKSEKALELTSKMLAMNPDCYTWWNYRREILINLYGGCEDVEGSTSLGLGMEAAASEDLKIPASRGAVVRNKELQLTVDGITKNPKSYPAWSHRQWILLRFECDYDHEIKLCNDMLDADQRNFHCWNYRRFVIETSGRSLTTELEYCTQKIEQNFSNYSAFHHRSVYFKRLHDDESFQKLLPTYKVEFSIVENATFTDPYDQSAWWYHRFLIKFLECGRPSLNEDDKEPILALLNDQIELFKPLIEFEPSCKWTIDAVLHLSIMVRAWEDGANSGISEEEKSLVAQLQQLDPLRTQRYRAMFA
jgi:geranylgeranyl transferase type-2 subunit alpha